MLTLVQLIEGTENIIPLTQTEIKNPKKEINLLQKMCLGGGEDFFVS